ncbi:hypothetical protein BSUBE1_2716 [Bacillus subtilis E1]|nr:hypothetical protein BSUBE1_2716 [Bacillus subtilis E1]
MLYGEDRGANFKSMPLEKMDSVKKAERGASPKQIKPHRYYLLAVH